MLPGASSEHISADSGLEAHRVLKKGCAFPDALMLLLCTKRGRTQSQEITAAC